MDDVKPGKVASHMLRGLAMKLRKKKAADFMAARHPVAEEEPEAIETEGVPLDGLDVSQLEELLAHEKDEDEEA